MDRPRRVARWLMGTVLICLVAAGSAAPAAAPPRSAAPPLEPSSLPLGAAPEVATLVRNTIVDGDRHVTATRRGRHDALWVAAKGYVVRDHDVGRAHATVLTYVDHLGGRREIVRARSLIDVALSPSGRRLAYRVPVHPDSLWYRVTVVNPATGVTVARRTMWLTTLVALTDHRVLLGRRTRWRDPASLWWNLRTGGVRRWYDEAALGADLVHDRVVFDQTTQVGEFCLRVARLSRPGPTLWRSCAWYPHQWSPDGTRALSTHTYFDAAGTDRWRVVDGRTGAWSATVRGRLDWDAVWEDDAHFLTLALGDDGRAAVVRCDLDGACERAGPLYDVGVPADPSVFYAAPPVVLARNR